MYTGTIIRYAKYVANGEMSRDEAIKELNLTEEEIKYLDDHIDYNRKYSTFGTQSNRGGGCVNNFEHPNDLGTAYETNPGKK